MFMCVYVYVWYPCVCMCGNQKLMSYVFCYTLSLNLELAHFSYATGQEALRIFLLPSPSARVTDVCYYVWFSYGLWGFELRSL